MRRLFFQYDWGNLKWYLLYDPAYQHIELAELSSNPRQDATTPRSSDRSWKTGIDAGTISIWSQQEYLAK